MLVSNGHSWLSVKHYTLAEIGIFLKAVLIQEEYNRIERFSELWNSKNLNEKGYKEHIKALSVLTGKHQAKSEKPKDMPQDEIESNWKGLAKAIGAMR